MESRKRWETVREENWQKECKEERKAERGNEQNIASLGDKINHWVHRKWKQKEKKKEKGERILG